MLKNSWNDVEKGDVVSYTWINSSQEKFTTIGIITEIYNKQYSIDDILCIEDSDNISGNTNIRFNNSDYKFSKVLFSCISPLEQLKINNPEYFL